jgi:hypothetical protein
MLSKFDNMQRFSCLNVRPSWARSLTASATATQPQQNSSVVQTAANIPVELVRNTLPEEKITQESMLVPVTALTPLPDSFAVISVGGKQVRTSSIMDLV